MIVLSEAELRKVLAGLPAYYPKSIQLAAIVRNRLNGQCIWPGTEIVVDQYPDYSVLMHRPIFGSKDFIGWPRSYCVNLFCRKIENLEEILRSDNFVDWTKRISFFAISRNDVLPIVAKRCQEMESVEPEVGDGDGACVQLLHLSHLVKRELPEGFILGELAEEHADQANREWRYGGPDTLPFFRALLRNKFPTSAVFTTEGRLVAYIFYKVDGCLFHGFVQPEFRRRGLYQVINYDLASKVVAMGHPFAFLYVMTWNEASLTAYRTLGARLVDPNVFAVDWQIFLPKP